MEKYTYEEFVEELRRFLLRELNLREKQIYFEAKDENGMTPTGDRLFIECYASAAGKEVCGVHIEEMYADYQDGITVEKIGSQVKEDIMKMKASGLLEKTKALNSYQTVKKDLFIRLLNKEQHQKELKTAVYKEIGDIAAVLYMKLGDRDNHTTSMKIRKGHLEEWNITQQDAWEDAVKNTFCMAPPRIYIWEKLLFNPYYKGEDFMGDEIYWLNQKRAIIGLCLSITVRTNGAVAVFLPGVAERLADLLNDSFYIVFTSIHEAMVHPVKCMDPEVLLQKVRETIEEATPKEYFLTENLYIYNRDQRKFAQYTPKTPVIDSCIHEDPDEK